MIDRTHNSQGRKCVRTSTIAENGTPRKELQHMGEWVSASRCTDAHRRTQEKKQEVAVYLRTFHASTIRTLAHLVRARLYVLLDAVEACCADERCGDGLVSEGECDGQGSNVNPLRLAVVRSGLARSLNLSRGRVPARRATVCQETHRHGRRIDDAELMILLAVV